MKLTFGLLMAVAGLSLIAFRVRDYVRDLRGAVKEELLDLVFDLPTALWMGLVLFALGAGLAWYEWTGG